MDRVAIDDDRKQVGRKSVLGEQAVGLRRPELNELVRLSGPGQEVADLVVAALEAAPDDGPVGRTGLTR